MARQVGDTWPAASGTASIGAEQINGIGGFIREIRPFAHVHMNSGVLHDPSRGGSGVLRFSSSADTGLPVFQISTDGGIIFSDLVPNTPHTLQAAYDGGPVILTDVASAPVTIIAHAGGKALQLGPVNEVAGVPLNISGVTQRYADSVSPLSIGDIRMHTSVFGADGRPMRGAITLADKNALSLGPGTLSIDCGSGIVPLAIASGVTTFVSISTPNIPNDNVGQEVEWNTAGNQVPDKFYTVTTGSTEIVINVPGLYKAEYVVSLTKIGGNLANTLQTELLVNGGGVFGARSFLYLRSSDDNKGTSNGIGIFNAEAGDVVAIEIKKVNNFQQRVQLSTRECVLNLQYIGPPRGGITH